jgi:hypothetical protein
VRRSIVEAGEGLVEQEHVGFREQRPGDRESLEHAPAEGPDTLIAHVQQAHPIQ